jgi:hypothetical protein
VWAKDDVWRAIMAKVKRGPIYLTLRGDIWGCVDIAAMNDAGFLFIQACTTAGVSAHRRKVEAHRWPRMGGYEIEIWESRKRRSLADGNKWEYAARIHRWIPWHKMWVVEKDAVIVKRGE